MVYKQLNDFIGKSNKDIEDNVNNDNNFNNTISLMNKILNNISNEANKYKIKPIILTSIRLKCCSNNEKVV